MVLGVQDIAVVWDLRVCGGLWVVLVRWGLNMVWASLGHLVGVLVV